MLLNSELDIKSGRSLLERIGGMETLNKGIDIFYEKLSLDPKLIEFFYPLNAKQESAESKAYLAHKFGAFPNYQSSYPYRAGNEIKRMTAEDVKLVNAHLRATLVELRIDDDLIEEIMDLLTKSKEEVMSMTFDNLNGGNV